MLDKSDIKTRAQLTGRPADAANRGRSFLRATGILVCVSLGAAMPFVLPFDMSRQYQVEARLEIVAPGSGSASADQLLRRTADALNAPKLLDALQKQMESMDVPGFAADAPSSLEVLSDIMARREITVAGQEAAQRDRLSRMLSVHRLQGSNLLVIQARAGDAETAAALANSAADLVSRTLSVTAPRGDTSAVEAARQRLDDAQVALDQVHVEPAELERFKTLDDDRAILDAQHARVTASIETTSQRAQALSSLKVMDVLTKPLPSALDGAGLDELRQRYLDGSLQVERLSAEFGPLHPRLVAAKGALEETRGDIAAALQRLATGYRQQGQALTQELATIEQRRQALDKTPVSTAVQQHIALKAELDLARKAYLDVMQTSGFAADPIQPQLRPEGGADPQMAIASGLPRWLYSLLGALSGLCLGAALLPSRRRDAQDVDAEMPLPATAAEPAKEPVVMPPVLPVAMPDPKVVQQPFLPTMPSFDDYYRDERLFAQAVELDLAQEDEEAWEPPHADNDDEVRHLQQILMHHLRPAQPEQPLPQLLAQIMSRADEREANVADDAAGAHDDDRQIEALRREIARLRRQVLEYRQQQPEPQERRYAARR